MAGNNTTATGQIRTCGRLKIVSRDQGMRSRRYQAIEA
jgi:hypothetical protein